MSDPTAPHPPLSDYYGDPSAREPFVRDIFDETAQWYDWTIRFLSFGSGDWYRRKALGRAGLRPGMTILDLATGTGVVAEAAMKVTGGDIGIVGADISIGMLREARRKTGIPTVLSPGERLPFPDDAFDLVTVGFAMRHFSDLGTTFRELRRVLRPGGRILILEITPPQSRVGRSLLGLYMNRIVPFAARLHSGSRRMQTLMHYYWDTTRTCVPPEAVLQSLADAGFLETRRHVEAIVSSEYTGTA
jgi:demethylmenaquinone methyltransferase / 2-methoxy-6-polyprenyl-1,4-benzoquinol methylase